MVAKLAAISILWCITSKVGWRVACDVYNAQAEVTWGIALGLWILIYIKQSTGYTQTKLSPSNRVCVDLSLSQKLLMQKLFPLLSFTPNK